MRPAGQVHGQPGFERSGRCLTGPADGPIGPLDERFRPREPEPPQLLSAQAAGCEPRNVAIRVDQLERVTGRAGRFVDVLRLGQSIANHSLPQTLVFRDWEPMTGGKREAVLGRAPEVQRHSGKRSYVAGQIGRIGPIANAAPSASEPRPRTGRPQSDGGSSLAVKERMS